MSAARGARSGSARGWRSASFGGIAAALLGAAGCAGPNAGLHAPDDPGIFLVPDAPRPVPDLRFLDAQGRKRSLADFRGKALVLNLWAPWCEPCRTEIDSLDRLQTRLGGPDFEVVALSLDRGGVDDVSRFYDKRGLKALGVYVDPSARAVGELGPKGIPTTVLVDPQGREVGRATGATGWNEIRVVREIERRLGREPSSASTATPTSAAIPAGEGPIREDEINPDDIWQDDNGEAEPTMAGPGPSDGGDGPQDPSTVSVWSTELPPPG